MNLKTIQHVLGNPYITTKDKENAILTCIAKDNKSFSHLLYLIKIREDLKDKTIKELNNLLSISTVCVKEVEEKSELAKMSNILGKIEEFYKSNDFVEPTMRFSWTREEMIDEILRLSGDEFETKQDMIALAKETVEQLKERLKCLQSENQ